MSYDKPPLTKEWIQDLNDKTLPLLEKENFYDDNDIELVLNAEVIRIEPDDKQIVTKNKVTID